MHAGKRQLALLVQHGTHRPALLQDSPPCLLCSYFKDEILRKQLYQLMHQRQLYKQHEQQQEAEARLRQQAEYKRQCKAQVRSFPAEST